MSLFQPRALMSALLASGLLAASMLPQTAAAGEFSRTTMDKMGIFLSNFTECQITAITRQGFMDDPAEVVHFGMCHDWINNHKLFSNRNKCGKETSKYNEFVHLDPKRITESAKRYLGYKFTDHQSSPDYRIAYDGHTYCWPAADGEQTPYVYVTEAYSMDDGSIRVKGSSYYPDAEEKADDTINVRAVIMPHEYNGKATWYLLSLEVDPKPFPD